MERSQTISKLAGALITFHLKVDKIKKDANNPFFKSKYASLTNILDAVSIPLAECGLAVTQFPTGHDGLTTLLIHAESGEFIESTYEMTGLKNTPQERGSLISYQRRYAITSVLNLNISDEDDDANASTYGGKATKPESKYDSNDGKQWLNKNTPLYMMACSKLATGETTIEAIKKTCKLSKEVEAELNNMYKPKANV
jgi:hypothetical protein